MLINPQGVDGGQTPTGMVAMLYFAKDGRSIEVEYYSTVRNMYYMPANQFTIKIPEYKNPNAVETTEATTDVIAEATETTEPTETAEVTEATEPVEEIHTDEKPDEETETTTEPQDSDSGATSYLVIMIVGGAVVVAAILGLCLGLKFRKRH